MGQPDNLVPFPLTLMVCVFEVSCPTWLVASQALIFTFISLMNTTELQTLPAGIKSNIARPQNPQCKKYGQLNIIVALPLTLTVCVFEVPCPTWLVAKH